MSIRSIAKLGAFAVVAAAGAAYYVHSKQKGSDHDDAVERQLAEADPEQQKLMAEECILLDDNDKVIGSISKKASHLMTNIDKGVLHRAFSVFLFNKKGELLLQKRSPAKITFPHYWANTCCSHPLHREDELIADDYLGVKNAARRKMEQELGINPEQVPLDSFQFLTRVHYKARSDDVWGEHEIDYILVCNPPEDVEVMPNPNEVAEVRYFAPEELREWVTTSEQRGDLVSPWFRIIERTKLHEWWAAMKKGELASLVEHDTIHRAGDFDSAPTSEVAVIPAPAEGSDGEAGSDQASETEVPPTAETATA